jgi:copper chaperone CopZ
MGLFKKRQAVGTTELKVTGMTCGHCEMRVSNALKDMPGVKDATADLKAERAVVTTDREVPIDALITAVKQAGYDAEPLE